MNRRYFQDKLFDGLVIANITELRVFKGIKKYFLFE